MSFDRDAMNSVEIDRKDDGFYSKIHFRGDTLQEKGPLKTREEGHDRRQIGSWQGWRRQGLRTERPPGRLLPGPCDWWHQPRSLCGTPCVIAASPDTTYIELRRVFPSIALTAFPLKG